MIVAEPTATGDFVDRGIEGLVSHLKDLRKMMDELGGRQAIDEKVDKDEEASFLELRVLQAVGRVTEGVQRLRVFAELNHAAMYKILKKHDKLLSSKEGLAEIFPRLVKATRINEVERFDALDEDLKKMSLASSKTEDIDASPEVARLIAGLGRSGVVGLTVQPVSHRSELVLSFFLGSSLALFLSIGVLLWLPEKSPRTFSEAYFLTPIPVFRVVFSFLLIMWCMGAVAKICGQADVNHMFILNVDPRCRVSPEWFFARAATLTTIWILVFGMYVVDYKWKIVPTVWSTEGFNKRASLHFVFYPLVLLLLAGLGAVMPSTICRNRYKLAVLRSVKRTAMAPVFPVDFADNMVGDIMTSIAKPLEDVPAAMCYLLSHHPQEEAVVRRFVTNGDNCSDATHSFVVPMLAGLPFFFRANQCVRRYRDTKESRHLWNLGKYLCSLLVVIVSRLDNTILLITVSTVATVYAFLWDVFLDWGLGLSELLRSAHAAEANGHVHEHGQPQKIQRHFPRKVYWLCSLFDLVARSTWVFTLMPTSLVTGNIVSRVIFVSLMSSVEILRRSMWAVLRIEYEQLSNASGFRALLWVPSKLNAASAPPERSVSVSLERRASNTSGDARQPLLS
ncbi:unnamed protein product [Effrenium voratum]|nr:unnamed protein product [Effrenium voratum]